MEAMVVCIEAMFVCMDAMLVCMEAMLVCMEAMLVCMEAMPAFVASTLAFMDAVSRRTTPRLEDTILMSVRVVRISSRSSATSPISFTNTSPPAALAMRPPETVRRERTRAV
ncbi:hypothetical protein [Pyxidicoccus caerfyrddinensis]|uniref:hypothetical protein n=1 Tax=Pyxidicoccus caerfyrddinensis TaxID=2709663 RepID=UPI001F077E8A|nr:hypothetical protein [Pyxidicoccus caerfyrddinensis]